MLCITIGYKSSCNTKIFYYACKSPFWEIINFFLRFWPGNWDFFSKLKWLHNPAWRQANWKNYGYFNKVWSSTPKNVSANLWETFMFIWMKKTDFICISFLRYWKGITNLLFWVIWACLATTQLKWYYQFEETSDVYLQPKTQLHPSCQKSIIDTSGTLILLVTFK